jgi:hypothetical protein
VECKLRCVNFRRVSDTRRAFLPGFRVTGSAGDKPGSADDKPGSAWEHRRQTEEHRRHVWEHLESQLSSLGKPSSLGTLLVRLEIKATVFSLYSHLYIYVSMYLYSYPSTQGISGLAAGGA